MTFFPKVGVYVFEKFFRGDVENVRSRKRYSGFLVERASLERKASATDTMSDAWLEPARGAVFLLKQANIRFELGSVDDKRAILRAIGLNPQLKDKQLLISAKKPFQLLLERSQFPVWSG